MPYIHPPARAHFDALIDQLNDLIVAPGDLNYVISRLAFLYLDGAPVYATLNRVVGVLECVKQEFYRRVVAPYEDQKCEQNGDVYAH